MRGVPPPLEDPSVQLVAHTHLPRTSPWERQSSVGQAPVGEDAQRYVAAGLLAFPLGVASLTR